MFDLNWSNMLCVCGCNESEGGFSVKRLATNVGPEQIAPEKCGEKHIMRFLSSNVIWCHQIIENLLGVSTRCFIENCSFYKGFQGVKSSQNIDF